MPVLSNKTLKIMKIKTIDVRAMEWFDKVNGNSYFSAVIEINYGMRDQKTVKIPFTYGYGNFYLQEAMKTLVNENIIKECQDESLRGYCERKGIILRKSIQEGCRRKDVKAFAA